MRPCKLLIGVLSLVSVALSAVLVYDHRNEKKTLPPTTRQQNLTSTMTQNFPNKNLLADALSPYLRQHADNPVHWYPWGRLAFERAREEDKPIFLSIGYSTCHWCHVMEHESFENQDIAEILNTYFIPIKVDREEHPVIDKIYMDAVVSMTGQGGWPLNVFLTPDLKPFFGGTYFPPESRWGRPGFKEVLLRIAELWRNDRSKLIQSAEDLTIHLERIAQGSTQTQDKATMEPDASLLERAALALQHHYDPQYGGFGTAPKFPTPHNLLFLMRYYNRSNDPHVLNMVTHTLNAVAAGGIHDHIGGGFHRYSTDREWNIPHYEKMLYDQALLSLAYTEAYQITKDAFFEETARQALDFVLSEMRLDKGGFATAFDADSADPDHPDRTEEGAFYLWRKDEIERCLDPDEWTLFQMLYEPVTETGLLSWDKTEGHKFTLRRSKNTFEAVAQKLGESIEVVRKRHQDLLNKLRTARDKRPKPLRDDKVLTDLNGLIIAALSWAAFVFDEPSYLKAAEDAVAFIQNNLRQSNGRLWHRWFEGQAGIDAHLDDYAFYLWGLINLYEAGGQPDILKEALRLQKIVDNDFLNEDKTAYYMSGPNADDLILRPATLEDGAVPSAQAILVWNILRLAQITAQPHAQELTHRLLKHKAGLLHRFPTAHTAALIALDFELGPDQEIIIAADAYATEKAFLKIIRDRFLPRAVWIKIPYDEKKREALINIAPYLKSYTPIQNKAAAYVCHNHQCLLPTTDPSDMEQNLQRSKPPPQP